MGNVYTLCSKQESEPFTIHASLPALVPPSEPAPLWTQKGLTEPRVDVRHQDSQAAGGPCYGPAPGRAGLVRDGL